MEENKFKDLMQQSKLEIQFPDFEENVMEQIRQKETSRRSVWRNLKYSWIFFFIGAFLGIFGSQYLSDFGIGIAGEHSKLILLLGEILIVIILTTQFDKLIQITFKKREK